MDELANDLGVHPGDVRVLLSWLDPDNGGLDTDGTLLDECGGEIREQFDKWCVRSVPAYWRPGNDPDAGKDATRRR